MDLPIDTNELRDVVIALQIASNSTENERFTVIAEQQYDIVA